MYTIDVSVNIFETQIDSKSTTRHVLVFHWVHLPNITWSTAASTADGQVVTVKSTEPF